MPIFRYPFFYNNYSNYYHKSYLSQFNNSNSFRDNSNQSNYLHNSSSFSHAKPNPSNESISDCNVSKKNNSKKLDDSNYFFELFGLKLYFDDILLICLIFFLYQEGVKDDELFISLILLLLS